MPKNVTYSPEDMLIFLSNIEKLEVKEAGLYIRFVNIEGVFSKKDFHEGSFTKELIILMEKHLSSKSTPKKRRKK
jgi:hypothetical protein